MKPLTELERSIQYGFSRPRLLEQAVTHSSYAHEQSDPVEDNERLEFLGDSILGFLVSETLFHRRPNIDEGQLSKLRAFLVSAANLVRYAEQIRLGRYLRLGRGEEKSGGRSKQALLVNAFEAVIAAVYLDGGLDAARAVVERLFSRQIEDVRLTSERVSDFKSALQEQLQGRGAPPAEYRLLDQRGPDHQKLFTVEARIDDGLSVRGTGSTKKAAEQAAAMRAIEALEDAGLPPSNGRAEQGGMPLAGGKTEEL
jgi:ribonuclease-3